MGNKIIKILQNIFIEEKVRGQNVNDNDLLLIHREILKKKPMLRSAFMYFYREMLNNSTAAKENEIDIELGSGAGFFKDIHPKIKTSDIRKSPNFDLEVNALDMPFDNNAVKNIYAINVFHHLSDPTKFLNECYRVLEDDGRLILVEPHNGFFSSFIHKKLHKDEFFDTAANDWKNNLINGPLSGANQAMSHIVFTRDLDRFNKIFENKLSLSKKIYMHNWLRYLFSGGVNFKQTLPNFMIPIFTLIEKILNPFAKHLSLHQMIVIKKLN